mgnify:FL=1
MPNTYEKPIYSKALIELAVNEGYSLIKKFLTKGTTIKFGIEAINNINETKILNKMPSSLPDSIKKLRSRETTKKSIIPEVINITTL